MGTDGIAAGHIVGYAGAETDKSSAAAADLSVWRMPRGVRPHPTRKLTNYEIRMRVTVHTFCRLLSFALSGLYSKWRARPGLQKNPPIPAYAGTCFTSGANKKNRLTAGANKRGVQARHQEQEPVNDTRFNNG